MDEIFKDVTSVAMAIVGVAIIAVIVSRNSQTSSVIQNASTGFAGVLGVAMGGAGPSLSMSSGG